MKYLPLVLACLLASSLPCFAQYDVIAIYADPAHSDCNYIHEIGAQVLTFYVFHYSSAGAAGSRFAAPYQHCMLEIDYGFDKRPFPNTTGDSQSGVAVLYGACRSGWTHVLTILYFDFPGFGTLPCCEYPVVPFASPAPGEIEAFGCDDAWRTIEGSAIWINGNASCSCSIPAGIPDGNGTWGSIKSLYAAEP